MVGVLSGSFPQLEMQELGPLPIQNQTFKVINMTDLALCSAVSAVHRCLQTHRKEKSFLMLQQQTSE